jgi:hypothetical protein
VCGTFSILIKSKLTRALIVTGLLSLLLRDGAGQVQQPGRYEIRLAHSEPGFEITPAFEDGLFLHRFAKNEQNNFLEIIRLDTGFTELWHGSLVIQKNLLLVSDRAEKKYIYFLFRHTNSNDFDLYKMNQENGEYTIFKINSFIRFNATEFQIAPEAALIGGYFNRIPLVLYFNLHTQQSKVLPGLLNEEGELTQVRVYKDGTFQVLIAARNFKKQKTIWIKSYQSDGSLIDNFAVTPEDNKSLIFGRSARSVNNMQIIAGVYGNRNSEYSRGLFIASIDPNGLQHLKYYNFGDLQNFFNYMKAKRTSRIKERIERRKIKGKKIKFNYRFLVHEVLAYKDQFIVLGEAFYPQYTSISGDYYRGFFSPYELYGNPVASDHIFEGYRYTHAIIIGFDRDGKLLWDNSFEINDVKTYTLEQFVRFEVQGEKIVLIYLYDNQIRTKIIQDSKVLEGKSIDPIHTSYDNDVLVKERNNVSQLNYWYDNFFYAYGIQSLENDLDPEATPKRRVFFVNKITYR